MLDANLFSPLCFYRLHPILEIVGNTHFHEQQSYY